jgi:ABC-type histidine transport system ATPase subunit
MGRMAHDVPVFTLGLTACFGTATVLKGVDLSARRGEILAVIGSSGGQIGAVTYRSGLEATQGQRDTPLWL